MSILVLGTVALDTVKTPARTRKNILGGSAAHFSMSARLFSKVHLVAIVGEDFPQKHIAFLESKGIVLTSLIRSAGSTFRWEGEYRGDLNTAQTRKTELGVLSVFNPLVHPSQKNIKNIFLANVDPDIQRRFLDNMVSPRLVGLDSMNFWISHKRKALLRLLKRVDIYVANDAEARLLSGQSNLIKAAKTLRRLGPPMVLIKKGEHGVLLYCDKFIFSLPAYPTDKVIDPTGAGDTFAGGLMGYLSKSQRINQRSLKRAIMFGTILASFNVEGFGMENAARLSMRDVLRRLAYFERIVRLN